MKFRFQLTPDAVVAAANYNLKIGGPKDATTPIENVKCYPEAAKFGEQLSGCGSVKFDYDMGRIELRTNGIFSTLRAIWLQRNPVVIESNRID